jgi:hypothetical protein
VSRLCQTVEFDDKVLVSKTLPRCTVFHEAPHQSPRVIELRIKCSEGVPDTVKVYADSCLKIRLIWLESRESLQMLHKYHDWTTILTLSVGELSPAHIPDPIGCPRFKSVRCALFSSLVRCAPMPLTSTSIRVRSFRLPALIRSGWSGDAGRGNGCADSVRALRQGQDDQGVARDLRVSRSSPRSERCADDRKRASEPTPYEQPS